MPVHSIEVDFEVLKALMVRRPTESVTYNDVIRKLLQLGEKPAVSLTESSGPWPNDWLVKGVRFAEGTEFRAKQSGKLHMAKVAEGALVLNGKKYDSPSAAAVSITGYAVNGWTFWEFRRPGEEWRPLATARGVR